MSTFAEAINKTLRQDGQQLMETGKLASQLEPALKSCDRLSFDDSAEALAYAGLHLLDRYGRINQVLEYLFRIGRLPLRIRGVRVLEVGAGPAPALYAIRDFYCDLLCWPGLEDIQLGPLSISDPLDRGQAWDPLLHHLSENVRILRDNAIGEGTFAFGRSVQDFEGFDVQQRHHQSVADKAARIAEEFDDADDPISNATAMRMAYQEGVQVPSGYDLVFLCNFLTQPSMTERFQQELLNLASSLTPGGLLIVLGGTGHRYPDLYKKVRAIAGAAKLRDVSPPEAFAANGDPEALQLVAKHVRENIKWALAKCPTKVQSSIIEVLPQDAVNDTVPFQLPNFQALVFVKQRPRQRRNRRKKLGQDEAGDKALPEWGEG